MLWKQALILLFSMLLLTGCGDLSRPMDFHFDTQYNVSQSATITSNTVTILGNQFAADITIVNGTYSINGGAYTSLPGKIGINQTLTIQQTSAATTGTPTVTTVTVGGFTTTFTSITSNTLSFATQSGVELSTVFTSNTITIPASWPSSAISITGGQYSINGGTYTNTTGTIGPGQTLTVQQTSAATPTTTTTTTVTVGSNTLTFQTVTKAIPTDQTGQVQITSFGPTNPTRDSSNNITFSMQVTFKVTTAALVNRSTPIPLLINWQALDSSGNVIFPTTGGNTTSQQIQTAITVTDTSTLSVTPAPYAGGTLPEAAYNTILTWHIVSITSTGI